MRRLTFVRAAALSAVGVLGFLYGGVTALAQPAFPTKTIKFVVPYPPGASTDNMARAFAKELEKETKSTVIVENRPGGGTSVGAMAVKAQPADGHTLLFQTGELLATKLSNPKLAYEFEDFEIIAPLAQTPYVLVAPAQVKNLEDLKVRAASKKGELDFASLGLGVNHYSMLSRKVADHLGVRARMIPYKGGMEGITAVMTGEIDAYFATVGLTHSQKDNEKLHPLAVTGVGSSQFLPGVKSFNELGVKDMVFNSYYGVAVRADTPEAIKSNLKQITLKVARSPVLQKVRSQISLEDFPGDLDAYKAETLRTFEMLKAAFEQEKGR